MTVVQKHNILKSIDRNIRLANLFLLERLQYLKTEIYCTTVSTRESKTVVNATIMLTSGLFIINV